MTRAVFRASDVTRAVKGAEAGGATVLSAGIRQDDGAIVLRLDGGPPASQALYVARCREFVKIGIARNAALRIAGMQSGCPFEIELLHVFNNRGHEEKRLHGRFDAHRERGEWFRFDGDVKAWVEAGCP